MHQPYNPCLKPKAFSHLALVQFKSYSFRVIFHVIGFTVKKVSAKGGQVF